MGDGILMSKLQLRLRACCFFLARFGSGVMTSKARLTLWRPAVAGSPPELNEYNKLMSAASCHSPLSCFCSSK